MVLTIVLLTALALLVCVAGTRKAFAALGLDLTATLLWLGIAEVAGEPARLPRLRVTS